MARNPSAWNQADAVELRTYIAKNPKFLKEMTNRLPTIEGTTMEARAVTGSDCNGFIQAIREIERMCQDEPVLDSPGFLPEN